MFENCFFFQGGEIKGKYQEKYQKEYNYFCTLKKTFNFFSGRAIQEPDIPGYNLSRNKGTRCKNHGMVEE